MYLLTKIDYFPQKKNWAIEEGILVSILVWCLNLYGF